jgi:hypothetical protein
MEVENLNKIILKKTLVFFVIFSFIGPGILPVINGENIYLCKIKNDYKGQTHCPINEYNMLDMDFIYNITENLSNIIFTEYNESAGEIAKGRAFGTKGEHAAAKYLANEMKNLDLYDPTDSTTPLYLEQIKNIKYFSVPPRLMDIIMYKLHKLTHAYEVLDYELKINHLSNNYNQFNNCKEKVVCQISPIKVNPKDNPEKIHNFSFKGLQIRKKPNSPKEWIDAFNFDKKEIPYVFIEKYGNSYRSRDPNASLKPIDKILRRIFIPIRTFLYDKGKFKKELVKKVLYGNLNYYRGCIYYDFNDNTYGDLISCTKGYTNPRITINGTIGKRLDSDKKNYTVDFFIKQRYNKSVISYNVIGQINGTDKSKTVIVCCLYDSVWSQGTADAAIGMAIVMGIAKYFKDYNIQPKYNLKFIGFGGEEAECRGARYYEATHRNEEIDYVIDMNQVGFYQKKPKLTLNIIGNREKFINEIWEVVKRTNYEQRVNYTAYIAKRWWPEGVLSDQYVFNIRSKTVCFLKDFPWVLHHRDGLNHTEGDVLKYFDRRDTAITGEIALNVTMYLAEGIKAENY